MVEQYGDMEIEIRVTPFVHDCSQSADPMTEVPQDHGT